MHMADALISPSVGAVFYAASAGFAVYGLKSIKKETNTLEYESDSKVSLMGVLGSFIFAAQMLNFAIPLTGSSGHIGGGILLAILLGSSRAFLVMGSVLLIQALFFADGGLLAFGCNWFNLGVFPCFVAYPLWRFLARKYKYVIATMVSSTIGLLLGAAAVTLQTTASGIAELPFVPFITAMLSIHLVIGLIEGAATSAVVVFLHKARPELIFGEKELQDNNKSRLSIKKIAVSFAVLTLIFGGFLSLYAASAPDGLEWAIERVSGKEDIEFGLDSPLHSAASVIQEKTSLFADYSLKSFSEKLGTSISGIVGSFLVMILIVCGAFLIAKRKAY
ncbi:MAG: energy-coupling factor ABC transporter permease [Synergistaceae bacterium]|nr:energy-coupling factor ABC transporter permease [Synergistaceae bacterium]